MLDQEKRKLAPENSSHASNKRAKKKDPFQEMVDLNPCGLCRSYNLPVCKGHGGGGGGGGDGSGSGKSHAETAGSTGSGSNPNHMDGKINHTPGMKMDDSGMLLSDKPTGLKFKIEIIAELLAKNLLSITNNSDLGILTIKCNPRLLSDEQKAEVKNFIRVVEDEFEKFKKEHHLPAHSGTVKTEKDHEGHAISFTLSIPNPALYDAFMKQLSSHKLFSALSAQQQKMSEEHIPQKDKSVKHRTPFSMDGPKPKWFEV